MKTAFLIVALSILLTSCATKPIDVATARSTPDERIYDKTLVAPSNDKVELILARDAGYVGSGCMTVVYLNGKIVSAIDNNEKTTLYVQPGRHILGTGPNPDGVGLCKGFAQRLRREIEINAEIGKPLRYRFATNDRGEISIMPTAF